MPWVIEYRKKGGRTKLFVNNGKPVLFNTMMLAIRALQTAFISEVQSDDLEYAGVAAFLPDPDVKENR
jgi:hypothetical protein